MQSPAGIGRDISPGWFEGSFARAFCLIGAYAGLSAAVALEAGSAAAQASAAVLPSTPTRLAASGMVVLIAGVCCHSALTAVARVLRQL